MNRLLTIVDTKYQRLEYLESSGTQYIDTGIIPSATKEFNIDFAFNDISAGRFGCLDGSISTIYRYYFGVVSSKFVASISRVYNHNIESADTNRHLFTLKNDGFYIDGVLKYSSTGEYDVANTSFYLFAIHDNVYQEVNYFCKGKMYGGTIYDNGVLIRHYVPVLRKSDNELGMLDLVEGKFYGNAGTGKFTANLDTMYAIIQGTPTVQDGRVSGFSDSNYLIADNNSLQNATDWEMCFKYNTGIFTDFCVLSTGNNNDNSRNFVLNISKNSNTFNFFVNYSSSWQVQLNSSSSGITIQANTDYWIKITFKNGIYSLYLSTDGKTYILCNSASGYAISNFTGIIFGRYNYITGNTAQGSFDLNRSYIKIDNTKYKLQAVVGYTVVGSPTISDGVVSGFSSSNYLQTSNTTSNENIEIVTRFKFNTSESGFKPIFGFRDIWAPPFCYVIANRVSGYAGDVYANLQNDTWYRLKFTYNGTIAKCEVYNDDNTLRASNSREYSATIQQAVVRIGGTYSTLTVVIDSIDLNNTYIKINNKLWFNGLEA